MAFQNSAIDPGTNPTSQVAVDAVSSALYQRVKLADPNADQAGAYGIDSNPMRVRPRRLGTADYDSGSVALGNTVVSVTSATVFLDGVLLVNITSVLQPVTVTDTAGDEVMKTSPLGPNESRVLPFNGMTMVGIKAGATNAASVKARFWGTQ